jgi:hypothetical protein
MNEMKFNLFGMIAITIAITVGNEIMVCWIISSRMHFEFVPTLHLLFWKKSKFNLKQLRINYPPSFHYIVDVMKDSCYLFSS